MMSDEERRAEQERARDKDRLLQIEELRAKLHRRMGGRYDAAEMAKLVDISQELDKLVVEVTRQQWSGSGTKPRKKR